MAPVARATGASTTEPSHTWRTAEIDDLLEAMAHRWQVAQLVDEGLPYLEVASRTHASTTTVTRVAHWLRYGEGGYRLGLDRRHRRRKTTARPSPGRRRAGCAGR